MLAVYGLYTCTTWRYFDIFVTYPLCVLTAIGSVLLCTCTYMYMWLTAGTKNYRQKQQLVQYCKKQDYSLLFLLRLSCLQNTCRRVPQKCNITRIIKGHDGREAQQCMNDATATAQEAGLIIGCGACDVSFPCYTLRYIHLYRLIRFTRA